MQLAVFILFLSFATVFGIAIQRHRDGDDYDSSDEQPQYYAAWRVEDPSTTTMKPPKGPTHTDRTRHLIRSFKARRTIGSNLTPAERDLILQEHNTARNNVNPPAANMRPMTWSVELATIAQNYADQCIWSHNSARSSQASTYGYVGENLYATTASTGYLTNGVFAWDDEKFDYDYSTNSCSGVCGHYTQVVWAGSTDLGCAVATCPSMQNLPSYFSNVKFLVCNYGPGGNYIGQKPYEKA